MPVQRNYWMHRISYEYNIKKLLLSQGILATGWSDGKNPNFFLNSTINSDRKAFDNLYFNEFGSLSHNRFCIYMFLHDFKQGDYIIVPDNGCFHVYEICGNQPMTCGNLKVLLAQKSVSLPFSFNSSNQIISTTSNQRLDLGFFWQVKPIELNICRSSYADNLLQKRLKFQMTNICLSDISQSVDDAIKNKQSNTPIILNQLISQSTNQAILKILRNKINSSQFEKLIKWYLLRIGASSAFIPAKNALKKNVGDVDVVARFDDLHVQILVQAKQHTNTTDVQAIKQIVMGRVYYIDPDYTNVLWIISTANFSKQAEHKALSESVHLINGIDFVNMLLDAGMKNLTI